MSTAQPPAGLPEAEQAVELYGPDDGGWFRTSVMDWIALCEDLRDADVRGYLVLRSLIGSKWARPVRKLTLNELCQLIPSPRGGPSGLTRVRDLLRELTGVGLVTTPEGAPLTTTSRTSGVDRPLRIRINDQAPPGYRGWRNAADKLAEVQAARSSAPPARGRRAGRNSDPRGASGRKDDPSGRKDDPSGRGSDPMGRNGDPLPGFDLPKRGSIFPSPTNSSLSCGPAPGPPPRRPSGGQGVAVGAVLCAWADGAGRTQPPASVRRRLAAQVPELLREFREIGQLQLVARFAGSRRWTDLGRAALHPECEQALGSRAAVAPSAGGREVQEDLLAEIGVTGTGL